MSIVVVGGLLQAGSGYASGMIREFAGNNGCPMGAVL